MSLWNIIDIFCFYVFGEKGFHKPGFDHTRCCTNTEILWNRSRLQEISSFLDGDYVVRLRMLLL